jgi:NAD-dependent SIR2 family protein deacetylase
MGEIYCNDCGAKVDEIPTLLPDQWPLCPRCGSLARRFEHTIASTVVRSDVETAADPLSVTPTDGPSPLRRHCRP